MVEMVGIKHLLVIELLEMWLNRIINIIIRTDVMKLQILSTKDTSFHMTIMNNSKLFSCDSNVMLIEAGLRLQ